jgi:hypothetical protein
MTLQPTDKGNKFIPQTLVAQTRRWELRITGFLDVDYRPIFWKLEKELFGNWTCFYPQVRGDTPTLLGSLERTNLNHWRTYSSF